MATATRTTRHLVSKTGIGLSWQQRWQHVLSTSGSAPSSVNATPKPFNEQQQQQQQQQRRRQQSTVSSPSSSTSTSTSSSSSSSSSVSATEVSKFTNLSHSWWDPNHNPLIAMNAIRMEYIVQKMKEVKKTGGGGTSTTSTTNTNTSTTTTVNDNGDDTQQHQSSLPLLPLPVFHGLKALDVGCGGGLLSESLARLGAQVTALDPSVALVEQAQKHADDVLWLESTSGGVGGSIDYKGGYTVEQLAEEQRASSNSDDDASLYDMICLLEVIEHVTDEASILQATQSLLKPNTGRLFISTLNRTCKSYGVAILGAEYVLGYLPSGTHDWHRFQSPHELQRKMQHYCTPPNVLQPLHTTGMVPTALPPVWNWKLDPTDHDINWIGMYYKPKQEPTE